VIRFESDFAVVFRHITKLSEFCYSDVLIKSSSLGTSFEIEKEALTSKREIETKPGSRLIKGALIP
jgi:hypothetical protein